MKRQALIILITTLLATFATQAQSIFITSEESGFKVTLGATFENTFAQDTYEPAFSNDDVWLRNISNGVAMHSRLNYSEWRVNGASYPTRDSLIAGLASVIYSNNFDLSSLNCFPETTQYLSSATDQTSRHRAWGDSIATAFGVPASFDYWTDSVSLDDITSVDSRSITVSNDTTLPPRLVIISEGTIPFVDIDTCDCTLQTISGRYYLDSVNTWFDPGVDTADLIVLYQPITKDGSLLDSIVGAFDLEGFPVQEQWNYFPINDVSGGSLGVFQIVPLAGFPAFTAVPLSNIDSIYFIIGQQDTSYIELNALEFIYEFACPNQPYVVTYDITTEEFSASSSSTVGDTVNIYSSDGTTPVDERRTVSIPNGAGTTELYIGQGAPFDWSTSFINSPVQQGTYHFARSPARWNAVGLTGVSWDMDFDLDPFDSRVAMTSERFNYNKHIQIWQDVIQLYHESNNQTFTIDSMSALWFIDTTTTANPAMAFGFTDSWNNGTVRMYNVSGQGQNIDFDTWNQFNVSTFDKTAPDNSVSINNSGLGFSTGFFDGRKSSNKFGISGTSNVIDPNNGAGNIQLFVRHSYPQVNNGDRYAQNKLNIDSTYGFELYLDDTLNITSSTALLIQQDDIDPKFRINVYSTNTLVADEIGATLHDKLLTTDRVFAFPDKDGTIALESAYQKWLNLTHTGTRDTLVLYDTTSYYFYDGIGSTDTIYLPVPTYGDNTDDVVIFNANVTQGVLTTVAGTTLNGSHPNYITIPEDGAIRLSIRDDSPDAWQTVGSDPEKVVPSEYAEIYIQEDTTSTIAVSTTPVVITGYQDGLASPDITLTDSSIIYTGATTRVFKVNFNCSFTSSANNIIYDATLNKNGVKVKKAEFRRKVGTGTDVGSASFSCIIKLATNDEIYVRTYIDSGTANQTFSTANLNIESIE